MKAKGENTKIRYNLIVIFVYIIGIVLLIQLFNLQIIHGQEYREKSNTRLTRESTLQSDRGNIKDSSGNVLATVKCEHSVYIYRTKTNDETLNRTLLRLANLLESNGDKYINNFLMRINPIRFVLDSEEEQKDWKKANNIDENCTPEETFNKFLEEFAIKGYSIEDAAKILALRYEISYNGYSAVRPVELAKNISDASFNQISEQSADFPGITIMDNPVRYYPLGKVASHIIGRIGQIEESELKGKEDIYDQNDIIGKSGIEYVFEKYLKGTNGIEQIDMDVDGEVKDEAITEEAIAGSDVILTIDSKLQQITEEALKNNIDKIASGEFGDDCEADAGAAVVMNVRTGEVLAMASYPDYYPEDFVDGISQERWNYYINGDTKPLENKAIATNYSPGSTFKMVTALAGLETNAISTTEEINDVGVYPYAHEPVCWYYSSYGGGHGWLNVSEAIIHSCNFFFYEVGRRIGIDNLSKYAYYLGLGHKTGIELDEEASGNLASNDRAKEEDRDWYLGETLSAAIGQSYNTFTPLQMAKYVSMIANRGKQIDVTIIKAIFNADGSEVPKSEYSNYANERLGIKDENLEQMTFNEENINAILEGMRGVTSESGGTAYSTFRDFDIEVGGKTGSAQTGIEGKTNAWFVGFAPYDNPEIAIVIFVRNGGHGGYTAEVAREIIAQYFGMNITTTQVTEDMTAYPSTVLIN